DDRRSAARQADPRGRWCAGGSVERGRAAQDASLHELDVASRTNIEDDVRCAGAEAVSEHDAGFGERGRVLQAVDARGDLAVAIQRLVDEPERVGRAPNRCSARASDCPGAASGCRAAGEANAADVLRYPAGQRRWRWWRDPGRADA